MVFAKLGILPKFAIASTRLRKCVPLVSDEGYEQLLTHPPSLQTMREYFNEALDKVEVALAKSAFARLAGRSTGPVGWVLHAAQLDRGHRRDEAVTGRELKNP